MLITLQKEKDGDSEAPVEDAREAGQGSMDPAIAHAHAVAAAAAAHRLNTSAAAAEHVRIAAIRRAAKFVTVTGLTRATARHTAPDLTPLQWCPQQPSRTPASIMSAADHVGSHRASCRRTSHLSRVGEGQKRRE